MDFFDLDKQIADFVSGCSNPPQKCELGWLLELQTLFTLNFIYLCIYGTISSQISLNLVMLDKLNDILITAFSYHLIPFHLCHTIKLQTDLCNHFIYKQIKYTYWSIKWQNYWNWVQGVMIGLQYSLLRLKDFGLNKKTSFSGGLKSLKNLVYYKNMLLLQWNY